MARRFHLQPLDAPLPVVPQGPLSKLPPVDAPRAPTRYVEPARPGVPSVGVGRTQFKLPKPGPRARLTDPASQPSFGALKGSAADAGAQALYGFNIEEIYDYDLPNIRSASATLTSMVGRTANPVAAARADALASKRLAPQAADELEGAVGGDGDEHPDMLVEDMGTQLKSGEEAANFFARHGNHTPTKFVYANRARTGDAFLPYSLMCVSREQAEAEYFTISATGVVHVFADKHPSEFMGLSQWIQESTFFNVLTSIRFFKHYLVSKMFRLWRSNVRYKLYCLQRNKLVRRLFLAKASFCPTLVEINALCYEMQNTKLLTIDAGSTYRVGDFLELQQEERARAAKTFEQHIDKLQALVEKVCRDVTTRARLSDDSLKPGDGAPSSSVPGNAASVPSKGGGNKSKSMVAARQEQLDRLHAVRLAAAEAQMLGAFIRLVDYMCVSCCFLLSVATAQELLGTVTVQPPRKNGLWSTVVAYGEHGMLFDPPERTFLSSLDSLLEATVVGMHNVPRLLYLRVFKQYFHHGAISGPNVPSMVQTSEGFTAAKAALMTHVHTNFEEVEKHATQFEKYRVVHVFGQHWSFEAYEQAHHTVDDFKVDMKQLKGWKDDIGNNLVKHKAVGTFLVESQKLKEGLDKHTSAIDQLQEMLLIAAKDECISTLQEFQSTMKLLSDRPRFLKEFAEFTRYVEQMRDGSKSLTAKARAVTEMYDLLEEYFSNLKIPTADEVKRDDLEDAKKHFNEVFEAAVAAVDDKKPKWIDSLEKSIATLSDDLLSILASLYSGDFMDPEIDPKVVLEKLEQVREELETISEKAETFAEWQRTFRIGDGEASLNSFKDTLTQYELKRDIWQRLDVWNESVARWKGDDFSKLKVEELRKDVEVYHEDISKLSKRLNTDPVVRHFMESIDAVRAYVPVIVDLGNTAMQTRHWKRVFERVEQPYFAGTTVSLEQLLKYGIEGHAVFIGEISGVASGEWALEQHLLKIKTAWEVTELPLTGHRDSAEMTLGSLEECVLLLKDSQVSLHTMMASPFVAAIRPEVEVWEKKLSVLSEVIDAWTTCQRNWIYLENIYGAEDIQKQLPGEAGKLQKVDKFFKDQMRKTNISPNVLEQVTKPGLLKAFVDANLVLDEIQKSLEEYLESNRQTFALRDAAEQSRPVRGRRAGTADDWTQFASCSAAAHEVGPPFDPAIVWTLASGSHRAKAGSCIFEFMAQTQHEEIAGEVVKDVVLPTAPSE